MAYHAVLKARASRVRPGLPADPAAPDRGPDDRETAALLNAELKRAVRRNTGCRWCCATCTGSPRRTPRSSSDCRPGRSPPGSAGADRLRDRLTRRGVATATVLFIADAGAVSPDLLTAAGRVRATPPADLTRLAEGAVAAMTPIRWKPAAALTAAALGLTLAAGRGVAGNPPTAQQPTKAEDKPAPVRGPATHWQSQKSRDNLHRVVAAIHGYMDEHNEFPKDVTDATGRPILSWRVAILPYLDLEFLHAQFKLDEPWDGPNNRKLLAFMPGVFRAPVQPPKATDTFVRAVVGPRAVFDPKAKVNIVDITDGSSNTLLLAEAGPAVPWTRPADIPFDPAGKPPAIAGPYTDAVHIATADSATYRMTTKPDYDQLRLFILRDDGEVFDRDRMRAAPAKPVSDEDAQGARRPESGRDQAAPDDGGVRGRPVPVRAGTPQARRRPAAVRVEGRDDGGVRGADA